MKNMIVHSLKFPEGEFTHTELARFNGKSNQTVWQRYLNARKTGQIISAGTRKTEKAKGSPALLWKVNPNFTMALMCVPQPVRNVEPAPAVPVEVVAVDTPADLQAQLAEALS